MTCDPRGLPDGPGESCWQAACFNRTNPGGLGIAATFPASPSAGSMWTQSQLWWLIFFLGATGSTPSLERLESGNRMFRFRVVNYSAESTGKENSTRIMSIQRSGLFSVQPTSPYPSPNNFRGVQNTDRTWSSPGTRDYLPASRVCP